uniref:Defensin-like protein n=1 Tax=Salix viminalis TaxID=40686 RepID=A0A6N2MUU8_SALVM
MEMVKVVAVHHLLLFFLVFISGTANMSVKAGDCRGGYLSTIGGGCPDKQQCLETCRPCYRGYGIVYAFCVGPSGPLPYWECRCSFHKGAPC